MGNMYNVDLRTHNADIWPVGKWIYAPQTFTAE